MVPEVKSAASALLKDILELMKEDVHDPGKLFRLFGVDQMTTEQRKVALQKATLVRLFGSLANS